MRRLFRRVPALLVLVLAMVTLPSIMNAANADPPAEITRLSVFAIDDGDGVTLTWTPHLDDGGSPVTGYVVGRTGAPDEVTAEPTKTWSGLAPGTYTFSVAAQNVDGTGPAVTRTFTLPLTDMPRNLTFTTNASGTSVTGRWADPVVGYPTFDYVVCLADRGCVLGVGRGYTWTSLTPGATYTMRVTPDTDDGSGTSASLTFTLPGPPGAPTGLTVTSDPAGSTATVTWSPPSSDGGSPILGYVAGRSGTTSRQDVAATSATWTGLTPGASYDFFVDARNAVGTGPAASVTFTMPAPGTPGPPRDVTVTPAANGRSATVTWSPPSSAGDSPVTGYTLARTGGTPVDVGLVGSHTWSGLTPGASYDFTVAARNAAGTGPVVTRSATMPDPDPEPTYVADAGVPGAGELATDPAPYDVDQTLLLHSRPGSDRTIFLDFDGTAFDSPNAWGLSDPVSGYSLDPDPAFSITEQEQIQSIWMRVAEDFRPFDVDVTTEYPGDAAIDRTDPADQQFGTRVLVTDDTSASAIPQCGGNCGGLSHLDVFDLAGAGQSGHEYFQPTLVFGHNLAGNDTKNIAEAVSHQVGHNFGLQHDGTPTQERYAGSTVWAPIMGMGYDKPIVQWSKGEYVDATNGENDLAIIQDNGAPPAPDDIGDTIPAAATQIPARAEISSAGDADVYRLTCPVDPDRGRAYAEVEMTPVPHSPDLNPDLELLDPSGNVVARDLDSISFRDRDHVDGLARAVFASGAAGVAAVFYLRVSAMSAAYGSLGEYGLIVDGCEQTSAPRAPSIRHVDLNAQGTAATVTWSRPSHAGGQPLTGFWVGRSGAGREHLTERTKTWTGLTPGATYTFSVWAENGSGLGPAASRRVTMTSTPSAPEIIDVTVMPGYTSTKVRWKLPVTPDNFPVTSYTVGRSGAPDETVPSSQLAKTWTGLTHGAAYTFTVQAHNAAGASPVSTHTFTMPDVPGAPTGLTVTADPQGTSATATWSPPASDGGRPVVQYLATRSGTTSIQTVDVTTATWSDLTPGATYTFSVRARNAIGDGAPATVQVTMPVKPSAPTGVTVTAAPDGHSATITWSPPGSVGNPPLTGYTVTRSGSSTPVRLGRVLNYTWTGLTPGSTYTFTVRARNAVGAGSAVSRTATLPNRPSVPAAVTLVTRANGSATLGWSWPDSNGGSTILGFTLTRTGSSTPIRLGRVLSYTWTGLTPGSRYTFTVRARNAVGAGPAVSRTASMPTAPTAPASVAVTPATNGRSAAVTWTAPTSDGGSAITGYTLTRNGGTPVTVATGMTYTWTGLTPGATYAFTVAARNAVGTGPQLSRTSTMPNPSTPPPPPPTATAPGAPILDKATGGRPGGKVTAKVTWTAPAGTGGSAITGYRVLVLTKGGRLVKPFAVAAGARRRVARLPRGRYVFVVVAVNALGEGPQSAGSRT